MKILRLLRYLLLGLAALVLLVLICVGSIWLYFHPSLQIQTGVVYGHRHGQDLTFDILRPAKPNGIGIVLMASGGWKSEAGSFRPWIAAPILRRGYTVFAVYHVAQPKATVMEITEDVNRAVRTVRPWAVDVASGVESAPGVKDEEKMRMFIDAAHGAQP